jgi:pSer/pThr/pTyr-binding forkhead associated (FHA) protein
MSESKMVTMAPHLWEALEQMSSEMGVATDALVSQAVFTLARLNGFVVPGRMGASAAAPAARAAGTQSAPPSLKPAAGKPPPRRPEPEPEPELPPEEEGNPFDEPEPPPEEAPSDAPADDFPDEPEPDLVPPPRPVTKGPSLTVIMAGRDPYRMTGDVFTIGRGKSCDFVIESNRVSREHVRVTREGADFFLEDLNSSNGTFFGPSKEKVTRRKIKDGDEFTLGTEKIKFQIRK